MRKAEARSRNKTFSLLLRVDFLLILAIAHRARKPRYIFMAAKPLRLNRIACLPGAR